jgi:hypothetical protein
VIPVRARRPWWQRLDGLPWDDQPDADERTRRFHEQPPGWPLGNPRGAAMALAYLAGAALLTQHWVLGLGASVSRSASVGCCGGCAATADYRLANVIGTATGDRE